jgi:hypothetical protein
MEPVSPKRHRRIHAWTVYWLLVVVAVVLATIFSHDLRLGAIAVFLGIFIGVNTYVSTHTDFGY